MDTGEQLKHNSRMHSESTNLSIHCITRRLLKTLHMKQKDELDRMMIEQIWKSHKVFRQYDFNQFKNWNTNMSKLVEKLKVQAQKDEALFEEDRIGEYKTTNNRGDPFWQHHQAKEQLKRDIADGIISGMKASEVWQSRPIYQEYKRGSFNSHLFAEKNKSKADPFWQNMRKKLKLREQYKKLQQHEQEWDEGILCKVMGKMTAH